jgi:tetratricopeptide (TPR) repeat protein
MKTAEKYQPQEYLNTSNPDKLRELGDCFNAVQQYHKAETYYKKALNIDSQNPLIYTGLGNTALALSDYQSARDYFNTAISLDSKCSAAYAGLAGLARKTEDYCLAFDCYLNCLELDSDNLNALLGLFQTSCRMGSFEKVTYYLEHYLNTYPDDTSVMFCLAALYKKDNRLLSAQKILKSLLKLDPRNQDAENLLEEIDHSIFQKLS